MNNVNYVNDFQKSYVGTTGNPKKRFLLKEFKSLVPSDGTWLIVTQAAQAVLFY